MLYYRFDDRESPLPAAKDVGSKALALLETTRAGLPVPNGFVLANDFFSEWLSEIQQGDAWKSFLTGTPEETKQHCDAIKECGRDELKMSVQMSQILSEALDSFDECQVFAVRSSSPTDDTDSSFAGAYETKLGVPRSGVEEAVKDCFLSVFDEKVVCYKQTRGIAVDELPRIALVVQEQVASAAGGVGFSINPTSNCFDDVIIQANFGLGETVAAGLVNPDSYIVHKTTHELVERTISPTKDKSVFANDDEWGGTCELQNENPGEACLADAKAVEIAQMMIKVEEHFGRPVDVEWAVSGDGDIHLLQARPITSYIPIFKEMLTEPGDDKLLYVDIIQLTQGFSECLSELGIDLWKRLAVASKGDIAIPAGRNGFFVDMHGRYYGNVGTWIKGLGAGAFRKMISTYEGPIRAIFDTLDMREYIPNNLCAEVKAARRNKVRGALLNVPGTVEGVLQPKRTLEKYQEKSEEIFKAAKEAATNLDDGRSFIEFVNSMTDSFRDLCKSANFLFAPLIARERLSKMFKEEEDADELLVWLQMNLPGNPTSQMGHLMCELASSPEVQETKSADEFEAKLKSREYSDHFMISYEEYMDHFGCRCIKEIDVATPRPYENPREFFSQLKQIDIKHNAINTVDSRSDEAYQKLLEMARSRRRERRFVRSAKIQHEMLGYREDPKYIVVLIIDALRQRALAIARRFRDEERIDSAEQIFDLTAEQIDSAEKDSTLDVRKLIEENVEPRHAVVDVKEWPRVFDSRGKVFFPVLKDKDDALACDPISPGTARGKVNVLRWPYEKPLLRGEILVTRAADPGWTPIFINAAAVVLEIGGPLQQGAITAREYGLPCVSGLEGATELLKDGQMIEVDGTRGTVRLIDEVSEGELGVEVREASVDSPCSLSEEAAEDVRDPEAMPESTTDATEQTIYGKEDLDEGERGRDGNADYSSPVEIGGDKASESNEGLTESTPRVNEWDGRRRSFSQQIRRVSEGEGGLNLFLKQLSLRRPEGTAYPEEKGNIIAEDDKISEEDESSDGEGNEKGLNALLTQLSLRRPEPKALLADETGEKGQTESSDANDDEGTEVTANLTKPSDERDPMKGIASFFNERLSLLSRPEEPAPEKVDQIGADETNETDASNLKAGKSDEGENINEGRGWMRGILSFGGDRRNVRKEETEDMHELKEGSGETDKDIQNEPKVFEEEGERMENDPNEVNAPVAKEEPIET